MPRGLSERMRRALLAAQTGDVPVWAVTLSHTSLPAPIRVNDSGKRLTIAGHVHEFVPFQLTLSEESETGPGEVQLQLTYVREIMEAVRSVSGPVSIALALVLCSAETGEPVGDAEYVPGEWQLRIVDYDETTIAGTLQLEDIANQPFPAHDMTPERLRGLA